MAPQNEGPRILVWDIETAHNLVAAFRLGDDYIPHTNILKERFIICAAWRWLGEKKTQAVSVLDDLKRFAKDVSDDLVVVKTLHKVLSEADILVHHNGDAFDLKWLNSRLIYHKLPPLPPILKVDTYKVAKNKFNFNSNRLDYLGKYLGFGGKKHTASGLWLRVLQGDKKAVQEMVVYNKRDVELLEKVFLRMRPFIAGYVNRQLFGGSGCPYCGSSHVQSRGTYKAKTRIYRRFQCQAAGCMGWFKSNKAEKFVTAQVIP